MGEAYVAPRLYPFFWLESFLNWNKLVDSMENYEAEAVTEHDFEKCLRQGFTIGLRKCP